MYDGLRARVTEKIKIGGKHSILKHTSCTVVGWQLHAGDRKPGAADELELSYLPKGIFLDIDGARWRIPGLPEGVFPLPSVQRTWLLTKEPKVSITRRGFTIVPDFASTAFMIQGGNRIPG